MEDEGQPSPLDVAVIETFEPFTMSCVMLVEVKTESECVGLGGHRRFILKMYDRRFA